MTVISKWVPDNNPWQGRRIGKTLEEAGELVTVLARISIQGLESVDPGTGKTNRQRLMEELSDVQAQIGCTVLALNLDQAFMARRTAEKIRLMGEFEAHLRTDSAST